MMPVAHPHRSEGGDKLEHRDFRPEQVRRQAGGRIFTVRLGLCAQPRDRISCSA